MNRRVSIISTPLMCRICLAFLLLLPAAARGDAVHTQLARLASETSGLRVGLITNPSGCDELGVPDADILLTTHGVNITAFFAPEHGLRGTLPPGVSGGDYTDPATSIPVYAVYGSRNAPTDAQMATVDVLVFDLQDVGARFYTFVWTMTYCMESAARNGKTFYVVDRPNPVGGMRVQGAPNAADFGLVGRLGPGATFGVATQHGMTAGEIAGMWNGEWMTPKADLRVLPVPGWSRDQWWTDTGRVFVKPSPNMRAPETATVYPGTCIFEGSNVSEGRGTDKPFEKIGAPFISAAAYADALTSLGLPGVQFVPVAFTPTASDFTGQPCGGVEVVVTDRDAFDPVLTGLHMLKTVKALYPAQVTITGYASTLMGVPNLATRLPAESVADIAAGWQATLNQFRVLRQLYLIYPEGPARVEESMKY